MPVQPDDLPETQRISLVAEKAVVTRRQVEGDLVRVTARTRTREHEIDEPLTHEQVEIERVPIGRVVDAMPPVREEGDTTIMPVVEEVVVVERRLVLKEEVHIRRIKVADRHQETIVLREQHAEITRTKAGAETPKPK